MSIRANQFVRRFKTSSAFVFWVFAVLSWQATTAYAEEPPAVEPPAGDQKPAAVVEPAAGDQEPPVAESADDDEKKDAPTSAEPSGPQIAEEEKWANWGTTKRDQKWVASPTETLARDPRNWVADESYHPGWITVPGMPIEFRFGGFIELNLIHDFQNAGIPSGEFIPSLIPAPTDFTPNTEFDIRSTRFIFESRTKAKTTWVSVFLSMDFAGTTSGTPGPRLRQAYFTFSGLLIGRAYGTFFDVQTWPDIFDLEGPNAMTASRTEMVRYSYGIVKSGQQQVPDKVIATIALENPETSVTNGVGLKAWPELVARLDLNYGWGHMAFMALGRQLIAESTLGTGKASQYTGSGAMSFKLLLPGSQAKHENAPSDDLVGQVTYGTAGGDYIQDLEALGGQDGYYNDATQQILTRRQLAIWGGYEHSWADQWHSAFVAGYLLVSNLAIEPADSYKSSIYTDVNITFRPIPRFAISCEYYFGRRTNKDDERGHAHRLMGVFKFTI
ncbi:MAG: DcaP family trimeric outer membrane transporter [Polyangiales bacterium]